MARACACVLALVSGLAATPAAAQPAVYPEEAVKAAFLYRFAAYVEWPAPAMQAGQFVIAVAGDEAVAAELERLLPDMSIHERPVRLRRVKGADELDGVHILYVGGDSDGNRRALLEDSAARPILVVTDGPGGLDDGGVINFISAGRNVRFEISLSAADRSGLKLGAGLLSVASRVEGGPQAGIECLVGLWRGGKLHRCRSGPSLVLTLPFGREGRG